MALKRHPALQDYSREHNDELMLVWKIGEGIRKKIDPKRIIDYCTFHYKEVTSLHMAKEEKYILEKLPANDLGRNKILHDHAALNDLVKRISENPSDPYKLLAELAESLEKHIRWEERIFFEKIQTELPEDVIKSMQPIESEAHECSTWNDAFWLRDNN